MLIQSSSASNFNTMKKGIGFCYREEAIKVSNSQCSSPLNRAYGLPQVSPSIQREVTCTYRVKLPTGKQVLISLTWSNQGTSVSISEHPFSCSESSIVLRKPRGTRTMEYLCTRVDVVWNFSQAQYGSGPEPITGFYLIITLDSEPSLILGDMDNEYNVKSECRLVSRTEHFLGTSLVETVARFCDTGACHEIVIECCGESKGSLVLSVCIDGKNVAEVKKLQWNFRGNETIFVDGLLVDMMWDVHDWVFGLKTGCGVFLFRTRNGMESRLWLEEKSVEGFCLRIFACKNPD